MPQKNDTNGIVIGEVCDLEDPDKLGRVRVTFPHLGGVKSDWAKLVSPMAGKERGIFFRPEKGDEVLVAFEHNDGNRPYILGSLWSQVDTPPPSEGSAKDNNIRFIRSRSGHILRLDDTKGKEKIEFINKDSQRRIVIDCDQKKFRSRRIRATSRSTRRRATSRWKPRPTSRSTRKATCPSKHRAACRSKRAAR